VVRASLPEHTHLHPELRPYSPLAVRHDPSVGALIAPWHAGFDPDAATWVDASGRKVRTDYPGGFSLGETLGQALTRVWRSADPASLDPEGLPANWATEGLLRPAPVVATAIRILGKEARHLGAGRETLSRPDQADYGGRDGWPDILQALRLLAHEQQTRQVVAKELDISTRWLEEITSGRVQPSPPTKRGLLTAVAERGAKWIQELHGPLELPRTEIGIVSLFLELSPPPARKCHQCGRFLTGRQQRWCSSACRKRYERRPVEQPELPASWG